MLPLHERCSPLTTQRRSQSFVVPSLDQPFDHRSDSSLKQAADRISHLDFSDLTEFQVVQDHYRHLGLHWSGAIAISPSNPAFGVQLPRLVLMPQSGQVSISVQFASPQCLTGACVTGAQQIKLTLFDAQNQPIAEQIAGNIRYVTSMAASVAVATYRLELLSENIMKAEFCSHAPFILSDLFWS